LRYEDGVDSAVKGEFDNARAAFLSLQPEWPEYFSAKYCIRVLDDVANGCLDPVSAKSLFEALRLSGRDNDHLMALMPLSQVLRAHANYAPAHLARGLIRVRLGEYKNAYSCFQMAVQHDPQSAEAHSSLGSSLLSRGNTSLAIAEFQQALARDSDCASAHGGLAMCYSQSNLRLAVHHRNRAIDLGHVVHVNCLDRISRLGPPSVPDS